MFQESFKLYKAKIPCPEFREVIDVDELTTVTKGKCSELDVLKEGFEIIEKFIPGILPVPQWKCFTLTNHPGLIIIRCPFTVQAQRYWIARCLRDYPKKPNIVNLNERLFSTNVLQNWWHELHQCNDSNERRRMKISMRWSTLGYHHNWDTKVYSEAMKTEFPNDLAEMSNYFASVLGFENFNAEAAIVNYYPIGTTLAGHTDHSEQNLEAPLFSFSFGQTAIFLIGGQTKEEKPTAVFLKSGDVLIMSRESRICFHAVPRVMKAKEESWNFPLADLRNGIETVQQYKRLKTDDDYKYENGHNSHACKLDMRLFNQVTDEIFWCDFKNYMNDSRININVRQVLKIGSCTL